jgi:hypothetical protein
MPSVGHLSFAWFLLIVTCAVVGAYPSAYGPFDKGETALRVGMRRCYSNNVVTIYSTAHTDDMVVTFPESAAVMRFERVVVASYPAWRIVLAGQDGMLMCTTTSLVPGHVSAIYGADFNADRQTDFIVTIESEGCGLQAIGSAVIFFLSSGDNHVSSEFYAYDFGPEDMIRLRRDGPCYYIANDLIGNGTETTRDGRAHNFWVYRLFRINGSRLIEADGDDPRFPKWVWYSFRDNHKETDLLASDQKRRLLRRLSSNGFGKPP